MDDATRKEVEANSTAYYDSTAYDNAEDTMPTLGSDNGLTLADLTGKAYDDPMWDQLLDQMSFEDMSLLVCAFCCHRIYLGGCKFTCKYTIF